MVRKSIFVGFVTVKQSNTYSHLTDYQRNSGPAKANYWFCHCEKFKHVQSPHWLPEDQWSCNSNIVGFATVRQSNMYSHLTDFQRTSGPVKAILLVLSLWDNQSCTVISLINRGPVVLLKQIVGFVTVWQSNMYSHLPDYRRTSGPVESHCETIKHIQSPHWFRYDQWSCKNNIVGFVTVIQWNMYSHLTDYQRTSGLVKTILFVLSLWDNQTCTVTSLITRGPVVL